MPNQKPEGSKRPKTRKDKANTPVTPPGKPTSETEHPVMETHPGARVPDPETGKKPKPVRKPRARKPKPAPEPSTTPEPGDSPEADTPSENG